MTRNVSCARALAIALACGAWGCRPPHPAPPCPPASAPPGVAPELEQSVEQAVHHGVHRLATRSESVSATPPSSVFPPDNDDKWFALETAGTIPRVSCGKKVRLIELRGWLRKVAGAANCEDPDWHYDLEIDPAWADERELDLNAILKVGNIVVMGQDRPSGGTGYTNVATPAVHVELNAWRVSTGPRRAPPPDWGFSSADPACPDAVWPYHPLNPIPGQPQLAEGRYVRMFGSLITDNPHYSSGHIPVFLFRYIGYKQSRRAEMRAVLKSWAGGRAEEDPANPARWVEMHPPDIIEVLPDRPRKETLRGVALLSENCFIGPCESQETSIDIYPPGPPPSPGARLGYREQVGPETNLRTIVHGNAARTGAEIAVLPDHIHAKVIVRGNGGWGAPGKFKALYRVYWE